MSEETPSTGPGERRPLGLLVCLMAVVSLAGCPTFKKKYSGTYRQENVDPVEERFHVEFDLFRFGRHTRGILRYYEPDVVTGDPFGQQTFCTWTREARFFEGDRHFELEIPENSRLGESELRGELVGERQLRMALYDRRTGESLVDSRRLERADDDPSSECSRASEFLIRPQFDLDAAASGENRMPPTVDYRIENPVFTVQWVGIERSIDPDSDDPFYAATTVPGPTTRLRESHVVPEKNGLDGELAVPLGPPDQQALVSSGETRYAIGHPVVVDDRRAEGPFSWEAGREPIVASALQRGHRPSAMSEADGFGQAVLYVEGRLDELSDDLLEGSFSGYERFGRSEGETPHFFIVGLDIDFSADEIVHVQIRDRSVTRSIPMEVSPLFLRSESGGLPGLFPL